MAYLLSPSTSSRVPITRAKMMSRTLMVATLRSELLMPSGDHTSAGDTCAEA